VIGHEGPKSLLSHLIELGLATSVFAADDQRVNHKNGVITVSISLTKLGLQNYTQVLGLLFGYIE
jgi:secreted Zn-dependent insulinase-like peptidase